MTSANFANMWAKRMANQQPVLSSFASAQPAQHPQYNDVDAYNQLKAGDTSSDFMTTGNALSKALTAQGGQPSLKIRPMQLAPVQGSSGKQSTALAKLLETMKPKFNSGALL